MSRHRGLGPGAFLAGSFVLVYFGAREIGVLPVVCEVVAALPAAYAASTLAVRARRSLGPERWFHTSLALSALAWAIGQLLWARAIAWNEDPGRGLSPILDFFFVGFLVPALAAALLGPAPRLARPDVLERVDATLGILALCFVFFRLVFVPNLFASSLRDLRSLLLALFSLATAAVAAARFFFADEAGPRRGYALLAIFAASYGLGSAVGNGIGPMPPPGSWLDLVWFVPFFFLAAVASRPRREWNRPPSWGLMLIVGPLPLVADALARILWRQGYAGSTFGVSVPFALLVGLGAAIRLGLQDWRDLKVRARLEEEARSGRLETLSAVTGPLLADLRRAVEMLAFRALNAAPALGVEAALVRDQVMRAIDLTREIEAALGGGHLEAPREVDVARLLEQTLQSEIDAGLPLQVRLTAGPLPPLVAEPRSLAAAFRELARNAAQASPRGSLEVRGERVPGAIVLRFADDGPGIPEEIRASVFDPFFTTGRAGAGPGLGLTLVHFVARELGGSVRLEPGDGRGASFALRLPLEGRLSPSRAPSLVFPALATASFATLVAITTGPTLPSGLARAGSSLAAIAAAFSLLRAARSKGARPQLRLLALGAMVAAAAPFLAHPAWRTLADWPWAAAVLLPFSASLVPGPGRRVVAWLMPLTFLAAHAAFVVMPLLASGSQTPTVSAFVGGFLRLGLAAAAAVLGARAATDEARSFFETLSLALALWAASASAGSWLRGLAPSGAERIADLAIVLPLLVFWRLGRDEAGPRALEDPGSASTQARNLQARAAAP